MNNEFERQNIRVARNQPCPMPGREDCMVRTDWQGQPAWWIDGDIWVPTGEVKDTARWDWLKDYLAGQE